MTVKELIKKIDTYNKLAEEIGSETKATLWFGFGYGRSQNFKTYAEFKKFIKEEYIDSCVDAILNYDGYEFNKTVSVAIHDNWLGDIAEEIDIWVE